MKTLRDLRPHYRAAWRLAAAPQTAQELMDGVPGLTPQMIRNMVSAGLLTHSGGTYAAVPGFVVPRHEAPRQALQAASVWEYARRWA